MNWADFWNGEHSIYVSGRHKRLHYDRIARDMAALLPAPSLDVMDYGCGEALGAGFLAEHCGHLWLYDVAPTVTQKLREQFAQNEKVIVLSQQALELLAPTSLDMIIVNSVLQYVKAEELGALLDFWHSKLKQNGQLVLADIIPPGASALDDVRALLAFAWQGGFFLSACKGLLATFFSPYRTLRSTLGLAHYAPEDMDVLLAAHGFQARQAERNIGHNPSRMTFVATKTSL